MKASGVQSFMNARFFGKKKLAPKGKALVKDKMEKKLATSQND